MKLRTGSRSLDPTGRRDGRAQSVIDTANEEFAELYPNVTVEV